MIFVDEGQNLTEYSMMEAADYRVCFFLLCLFLLVFHFDRSTFVQNKRIEASFIRVEIRKYVYLRFFLKCGRIHLLKAMQLKILFETYYSVLFDHFT